MDTIKVWTTLLAFSLLVAAGAAPAEEQTIAISDFAFSPENEAPRCHEAQPPGHEDEQRQPGVSRAAA